MKNYRSFIIDNLKTFKKLALITFILMTARGVLSALSPFIYSKYINTLVESLSFSKSYHFALLYGFVVIGNIILGYFEIKMIKTFSLSIEIKSVQEKLLTLIQSFHHDNYSENSEVDRIRKDIKQISIFISSALLNFPVQTVRVLVSFLVVYTISPKLALFVVFLPILLKYVFEKFKPKLNEIDLRLKNSDSAFQGELLRYISKINLIARHLSEPIANKALSASFDSYRNSSLVGAKNSYYFNATNQLIFFIFNIFTMIICGYLFEKDQIQIGHIGLTLAYFAQFNDLFTQLVQSGREFNETNVSFERSLKLDDKKPTGVLSQTLRLNNVFSQNAPSLKVGVDSLFRGNKNILNNFQMTFESGKTYHLIGENGKGKTSLLKAIGLEKISAIGAIEYQGSSRNPIHLHSQENIFYFDTIKKNFDFWKVSLNSPKVQALFSNLFPDVSSFEDFVNKDVNSLSGGQKQKLQILLSFAIDSDILCLDEPFTGLDGKAIQNLKSFIFARNQSGKITIIVAHDQLFTDMQVQTIRIGESNEAETVA